MKNELAFDPEYTQLIADIKQRYRQSQLKAAYAVNREMIQFYWELGNTIVEKQTKTTWGSKFLEQLSRDLQAEFPGSAGFSVTNLKYMRKFAQTFHAISQQPVAQLPWGHIILLIQQVKDPEARYWYAQNTLKNGIARSVLTMQIEQNLYERQGKNDHKLTNFAERLPSPQSDLAMQLFKDPYDFRFLPVTEEAQELEIENAMVSHLPKLFFELGTGFAYMGNQYPITLGDKEYFLDMLFYHVHLRAYVVVELKAQELKPEHVGKLNFYLAIVDDLLRKPDDHPSIGLLLCKKKNKLVAEYSLKRTDGAMGIAEYLVSQELPKELQEKFPDPQLLEERLADKIEDEK